MSFGAGRIRKIFIVAAGAEIATGLALISSPSFVVPLLVHGAMTDVTLVVGRFLGVAMLAVGMACWPERRRDVPSSAAYLAMLAYSVLSALFLAYVDVVLHLGGLLLWPAVLYHVVIALLLPWSLHSMQREAPVEGDAGLDPRSSQTRRMS